MQTNNDVLATEIERVRPKLATLYDYDNKFFSTVEKREVEVISKRDMRIPLKMSPGGYFGYFDPANGDMGVGDAPKYDKGVISTVHMKIGIQWDLESEWATDDKRKATINNVRENIADAMKEFRRQSEAQCMTAGTGVVATVTSVVTASGTDTVTCTTDGYGVKLLRKGQKVKVYNSARTTDRTASGPVKVSKVDLANNAFDIPSVTGITGTDVILPEGLSGSTPIGLYGVPYHVSSATTGTWLGLTRSSTPEVVASRVNANSSSLGWSMGRLAVNKIGDRVGEDQAGGFKPVAWMHPAQKQAYENLGQLVSVIQKQAKQEGLDLYFNDNMQIAGCPIKTSYLWDKTRIDLLIMELWGRAELKAIGWHEVGGRRIFEMRGPSGAVAASSVSYITASWNLFNMNPTAGSFIDSLTKPSGY